MCVCARARVCVWLFCQNSLVELNGQGHTDVSYNVYRPWSAVCRRGKGVAMLCVP